MNKLFEILKSDQLLLALNLKPAEQLNRSFINIQDDKSVTRIDIDPFFVEEYFFFYPRRHRREFAAFWGVPFEFFFPKEDTFQHTNMYVLDCTNKGISRLGKMDIHRDKPDFQIFINWIESYEVSLNVLDLFDKKAFIQTVPKNTLSLLLSNSQANFGKGSNFDNTLNLIVKDEPIFSETLSFSKQTHEDSDQEVTLFYGTTRNNIGGKDLNNFYGGDFEAGEQVILKQGICKVNIPPAHLVGVIERPPMDLNIKIFKWLFPEKTKWHVMITDIAEQSLTDFNAFLAEQIKQSTNKSALIFIHGYNNTFAEAARRSAQLTKDIPFIENISGFFSWPAKGGVLDYERDIARVEASVTAFADFIENLVHSCGIKSLHFVAHSMGNQLLTKGLLKLSERESFKNNISSISQVVLAAPDIDQTTFRTEILPYFKSLGSIRTLYASKHDEALKTSEALRRGLLRLGEGGENVFVAEGLDTIDASNVESDAMAHSYVFEGKETLADLFYLINHGHTADQRRLQKLEKNDIPYYIFSA